MVTSEKVGRHLIRDSRLYSSWPLTGMGEENIFFNPFMVLVLDWRLNWQRQNKRKAYKFNWNFTCTWETSQENKDLGKWPEQEVFIPFRQINNKKKHISLCRTERQRGSKWWRSNWENKGYLTKFVCIDFSSPNSLSLVAEYIPPQYREGSMTCFSEKVWGEGSQRPSCFWHFLKLLPLTIFKVPTGHILGKCVPNPIIDHVSIWVWI